MPLAIISIVLGILSSFTGIIIIPVAGFGLGASSMIRENRKDKKRKSVLWVAAVGIIINVIIIGVMMVSVYS
jgi:hypothetical protein